MNNCDKLSKVCTRLGGPETSVLTASVPKSGHCFAVAEIDRSASPERPIPISLPALQTYILLLHLEHCARNVELENSSHVSDGSCTNGTTSIFDLCDGMRLKLNGPCRCLALLLPHDLLDDVARLLPGQAQNGLVDVRMARDDVIECLGMAIQSLFGRAAYSELLLGHIGIAMCAHLLTRYGVQRRQSFSQVNARSSSTPLPKDFVLRYLSDDASAKMLADQVGLPVAEFVASFSEVLGKSPQDWLTGLRVKRAIELRNRTSMDFVAIATACGFGNTEALSNAFSEVTGVPIASYKFMDT